MQYSLLWRNKWLTADALTIEDMVVLLRSAADELAEMGKAGIILDPDGGASDDYARLVTEDPEIAEKFGFEVVLAPEDEEDFEKEVFDE